MILLVRYIHPHNIRDGFSHKCNVLSVVIMLIYLPSAAIKYFMFSDGRDMTLMQQTHGDQQTTFMNIE